ncbi:hypothetical protein ABZO31_07395 [Streptomyces sp. HUAS MG47]|uniref:hypothetical protein n=1 Tax=Streptomyces solicamelliae TaxID=3231716 RepID=UPI003877A051
MATSGDRRRTLWAAALLLAAAQTAGCTSAGPAPRPDPAPPPRPPVTQRTLAGACEVPLPAAWRAALDAGALRTPRGARAVLADAGPGWTAVQLTEDGRRRAALVVGGGGPPRTLLALADPVEHQLLGADFDGRYAVFAVLEGRTLDSPWSLYLWDSRTSAARRLARADRPGPLPRPVLRDATVFWAQGVGGGRATVYAAPAAGGPPRAVHTGVMDAPFAAGRLLVWRESSGTGTRLTAVERATLRPAALPAPVAALRDVRAVASDGATWAWVAGEPQQRLMVWRTDDVRPVAAVTGSPGADGVDQVRVNGRLVTWRTSETSYALEPAAGSYARITPPYGYAQGAGGTLAVAYSEGDAKTAGARAVIRVVRADGLLRLPGCG